MPDAKPLTAEEFAEVQAVFARYKLDYPLDKLVQNFCKIGDTLLATVRDRERERDAARSVSEEWRKRAEQDGAERDELQRRFDVANKQLEFHHSDCVRIAGEHLSMGQRIDELQRQLAECRKDTERLDWLGSNVLDVCDLVGSAEGDVCISMGWEPITMHKGKGIREAIDAARIAQGQPHATTSIE